MATSSKGTSSTSSTSSTPANPDPAAPSSPVDTSSDPASSSTAGGASSSSSTPDAGGTPDNAGSYDPATDGPKDATLPGGGVLSYVPGDALTGDTGADAGASSAELRVTDPDGSVRSVPVESKDEATTLHRFIAAAAHLLGGGL